MRKPSFKPGDVVYFYLSDDEYIEVSGTREGVRVRTFPDYIAVQPDCGNVVEVVARKIECPSS